MSEYTYQKIKINDHTFEKIPTFGRKEDKRPGKGTDICAEPFVNAAFMGRKEVGKTSAMYKLLKEILTRDTVVYIFSHTVKQDPNWINMREWMKRKGIKVHIFTQISGNLEPIIAELKKRAEDEEAERQGTGDIIETITKRMMAPSLFFDVDSDDEDTTIQYKFDIPNHHKSEKAPYMVPDCLFIFDDIGDELRSQPLQSLLKEHRHWRTGTIFSSQNVMDLHPQSRRQINLWMVFRGELEKLPEIYKNASVMIPYSLFEHMYLDATDVVRLKYMKGGSEKTLYEPFYIFEGNKDYRQGYNTKFNLPKSAINAR